MVGVRHVVAEKSETWRDSLWRSAEQVKVYKERLTEKCREVADLQLKIETLEAGSSELSLLENRGWHCGFITASSLIICQCRHGNQLGK